MKYMSGHLEGAVNLPVYTAFDEQARLMEPESLARWAADAGLSNDRTPLLYDSVDGQNGAMLSWIIQYLGCPKVLLMDTFFEGWKADGGDVFYRPVSPTAAEFSPTINEAIRARWDDLSQGSSGPLIDFRSEKEYSGQDGEQGTGGHIPNAAHLEWRSLVGENNAYLAPDDHLTSLFNPLLRDSEGPVAYCRTGPRASLGFLALSKLGYSSRLYDGSMTDWLRHNGPLETS
jgi:thiosulfate/3-mercaptopyruvate sulfurtransferase